MIFHARLTLTFADGGGKFLSGKKSKIEEVFLPALRYDVDACN